jgi:hypothetical protein
LPGSVFARLELHESGHFAYGFDPASLPGSVFARLELHESDHFWAAA